MNKKLEELKQHIEQCVREEGWNSIVCISTKADENGKYETISGLQGLAEDLYEELCMEFANGNAQLFYITYSGILAFLTCENIVDKDDPIITKLKNIYMKAIMHIKSKTQNNG